MLTKGGLTKRQNERNQLFHIQKTKYNRSTTSASRQNQGAPRYSISEVRITPTCQRAKHQRHEPLSRFSGQLFFIHLMIASHLSHCRVSIWLPILTTFGNHCDTNQAAFKTTNSLSFYRFLLTCDDCGTPFLYHWAHFWCPGEALGTTMGHQKEPLGPPWRTFTARHQKQPKKSLFGDLFWSPDLMTFLVFSCPCFYMSCRHGKWCPNVSKK